MLLPSPSLFPIPPYFFFSSLFFLLLISFYIYSGDPCGWFGITCQPDPNNSSASTIIEINLYSNNLQGTFPATFGRGIFPPSLFFLFFYFCLFLMVFTFFFLFVYFICLNLFSRSDQSTAIRPHSQQNHRYANPPYTSGFHLTLFSFPLFISPH